MDMNFTCCFTDSGFSSNITHVTCIPTKLHCGLIPNRRHISYSPKHPDQLGTH